MDVNVFLHLILMLAINIIILISGLMLNALVIYCWLKSPQMRKKTCHFTIGILSCVDLLTVATNPPALILELTLWIGEKDFPSNVRFVTHYFHIFTSFSSFTLLLVCVERYMGAYHPVFHRSKITKPLLVKLEFVFLFISSISFSLSLASWYIASAVLFNLLFVIPFFYVNIKLHVIVKEHRRTKATTPENRLHFLRKKNLSLKTISTCLILCAFILICYVPSAIALILRAFKASMNAQNISYNWSRTFWCINCSTNCLVIFWKNKILRAEAISILTFSSKTLN